MRKEMIVRPSSAHLHGKPWKEEDEEATAHTITRRLWPCGKLFVMINAFRHNLSGGEESSRGETKAAVVHNPRQTRMRKSLLLLQTCKVEIRVHLSSGACTALSGRSSGPFSISLSFFFPRQKIETASSRSGPVSTTIFPLYCSFVPLYFEALSFS